MTTRSAFSHTGCYQTLAAVAAVVGHYDYLVAPGSNLLFEYYQLTGTGREHRDNAVSGLLHGLDYGQKRSHANATATAHHCAYFLYMSGLSQGAHYVYQ